MNLLSIKRANKKKPLSPREKAILCLWDTMKGEFDLSEDKTKKSISRILLSYKNVYSEEELEALVTPLYENDYNQFQDWRRLIVMTTDYDYLAYAFYQQALSYINEAYLYVHKMLIYKTETPDFYSINLAKKVTHQELINGAYHALTMYYRFLIPILVNQILLQNAFEAKKELHSVECLLNLDKILSQTEEDPRVFNLKSISSDLLKTTNRVIKDHVYYLRKSYTYCFSRRYFEDNRQNIKRLVKSRLKEYCPALYPNVDTKLDRLV